MRTYWKTYIYNFFILFCWEFGHCMLDDFFRLRPSNFRSLVSICFFKGALTWINHWEAWWRSFIMSTQSAYDVSPSHCMFLQSHIQNIKVQLWLHIFTTHYVQKMLMTINRWIVKFKGCTDTYFFQNILKNRFTHFTVFWSLTGIFAVTVLLKHCFLFKCFIKLNEDVHFFQWLIRGCVVEMC